jgi:hypothetical protein
MLSDGSGLYPNVELTLLLVTLAVPDPDCCSLRVVRKFMPSEIVLLKL